MNELMAEGARIIAFRGAGSVNGIDPIATDAMREMLHRHVLDLTDGGTPVVLMYDGDSDVRERPDLGSVFGALVDSLADNPRVTTMAVQTKGWYKPKREDAALASANGNPYETYVFDENMPEIDSSLGGRGMAHSALTQSEALVAYQNYEQVIIGAAGPITAAQLHDLTRKAAHRPRTAGPVPVTILAAPINPTLDERIRYTAQNDPDEVKRKRALEKIVRRKVRPYGALCSSTGELDLRESDYPNISFQLLLVG